jgi:hypothetical protein
MRFMRKGIATLGSKINSFAGEVYGPCLSLEQGTDEPRAQRQAGDEKLPAVQQPVLMR